MRKQSDGDKDQVEKCSRQCKPLPCPVAMGHQGQIEDTQGHQDRSPGWDAKETKTSPYRDELGNESQEIAQSKVNHRKPAPERPKTIKDQLSMAALGNSSQAHGHLLHHNGHHEGQNDKRKEEPDAIARAGCCVGNHAGAVVFPQHDQNSRTNEQPQKTQPRETTAASTSCRDQRPVMGPVNVLMGNHQLGFGSCLHRVCSGCRFIQNQLISRF